MNKKTETLGELKYSKAQLLMSNRFRHQRDIVDAVLEDGEYTIAEAEGMVEGFLKGKVK